MVRPTDPMTDFAKAEAKWYPTWPSKAEDRAMVVYVHNSRSHRRLIDHFCAGIT